MLATAVGSPQGQAFFSISMVPLGCVSQMRTPNWNVDSKRTGCVQNIYLFIYIFKFLISLAALGLHCNARASVWLWHMRFSSCSPGLGSCSTWASLPDSMWDLTSPTRDQTHVLYFGRQILNHWTTREVLNTRNNSSWLYWGLGNCNKQTKKMR